MSLRLYEPCLPTKALKPPVGSNWVHEIKHDGYRLIARRVGYRVMPSGVQVGPGARSSLSGFRPGY